MPRRGGREAKAKRRKQEDRFSFAAGGKRRRSKGSANVQSTSKRSRIERQNEDDGEVEQQDEEGGTVKCERCMLGDPTSETIEAVVQCDLCQVWHHQVCHATRVATEPPTKAPDATDLEHAYACNDTVDWNVVSFNCRVCTAASPLQDGPSTAHHPPKDNAMDISPTLGPLHTTLSHDGPLTAASVPDISNQSEVRHFEGRAEGLLSLSAAVEDGSYDGDGVTEAAASAPASRRASPEPDIVTPKARSVVYPKALDSLWRPDIVEQQTLSDEQHGSIYTVGQIGPQCALLEKGQRTHSFTADAIGGATSKPPSLDLLTIHQHHRDRVHSGILGTINRVTDDVFVNGFELPADTFRLCSNTPCAGKLRTRGRCTLCYQYYERNESERPICGQCHRGPGPTGVLDDNGLCRECAGSPPSLCSNTPCVGKAVTGGRCPGCDSHHRKYGTERQLCRQCHRGPGKSLSLDDNGLCRECAQPSSCSNTPCIAEPNTKGRCTPCHNHHYRLDSERPICTLCHRGTGVAADNDLCRECSIANDNDDAMSDLDSSDDVPLDDIHRVLPVEESDEMDQTSWLEEAWAEQPRKKGVTSFDTDQNRHRRLLAFEYVAPETVDPEAESAPQPDLNTDIDIFLSLLNKLTQTDLAVCRLALLYFAYIKDWSNYAQVHGTIPINKSGTADQRLQLNFHISGFRRSMRLTAAQLALLVREQVSTDLVLSVQKQIATVLALCHIKTAAAGLINFGDALFLYLAPMLPAGLAIQLDNLCHTIDGAVITSFVGTRQLARRGQRRTYKQQWVAFMLGGRSAIAAGRASPTGRGKCLGCHDWVEYDNLSRPNPFNADNGDFKLTVNTNTSRSGQSDDDRKRLRTLMFYLCLVELMRQSCHPLFVAVVSAKINIGHFRCKRSLGKITRYRIEAAGHAPGSVYDMSVAIRDWASNPAHSTSTLSDGTRYLNALIQCLKVTRPFVVAIEAVGSKSSPRSGVQETVATMLSRVFSTLDGSGSEPSLIGLWYTIRREIPSLDGEEDHRAVDALAMILRFLQSQPGLDSLQDLFGPCEPTLEWMVNVDITSSTDPIELGQLVGEQAVGHPPVLLVALDHKPSEMPAMFCLPKDDLILEDAPSGNNSARYRLYAVVHQGLLGYSASVASYNQLGDETWLYIEGRSISPDSFAGIAGNRKTPVLLWYRQISQ